MLQKYFMCAFVLAMLMQSKSWDMSVSLQELKELNNYQLGVLCHDYHVTPGHITSENRALVERRLLVAILKARGKDQAKIALQQRPIQRGESVSSLHKDSRSLAGRRLKPSKIPIYKAQNQNMPRYTRQTGGAISSIANSQPKMYQNCDETNTRLQSNELQTVDELKSTSNEPLLNDVFVENVTNVEVPIGNTMSHQSMHVDKLSQTPCGETTDHELEIRTINYLSKEQKVKLTTDRNSQEYLHNLNEVITSTVTKDNDSDDLEANGRRFSLYNIGNIRLVCVGAAIILCSAIIYRNVK